MRTLMWFRADLRVRDNRALSAAAAAATDGIVAVFAICPEQWRAHDWGPRRVDFLLHNLAMLSDELNRLHIPLLLIQTPRFDDVPAALFRLSEQHGCGRLYFNDEYEVNEFKRDAAVERLFASHGVPVRRFCDQTILDVSEIRSSSGGFYSVFTPFQRAWQTKYEREGVGEALDPPPRQPKLKIERDFIPSELPGFELRGQRLDAFPAGEDQAKKRLVKFLDERIERYEENRDYPAVRATSGLSAYLALGVISPRDCFRGALRPYSGDLEEADDGTRAWITELIWREFYRHVLIGWPRVCRNRAFLPETERIRWNVNEKHFEAWTLGRTGVPIVDAGMRQLAELGWMHNRVRMIVATFLAKNLFLDWRLGEAFFMRNLVDGDFASNNGGWQWAAGTGTDAAPYFRVFNPFAQGQKFDPEGDYVRTYVPELARLTGKQIHAEPEKRDWSRRVDYVPPIVDVSETRKLAIERFAAVFEKPA
jgi:deoxyribodipyrimidine photo-lyase